MHALFSVLDIEISLHLYLTHEQLTNYSDLNKEMTKSFILPKDNLCLYILHHISKRTCCFRVDYMKKVNQILIIHRHFSLFFLLHITVFNFLMRTIDTYTYEMSNQLVVHFCQKLPVHFFNCTPEKTTMEMTGQREEEEEIQKERKLRCNN